jgi:hypothetical protein
MHECTSNHPNNNSNIRNNGSSSVVSVSVLRYSIISVYGSTVYSLDLRAIETLCDYNNDTFYRAIFWINSRSTKRNEHAPLLLDAVFRATRVSIVYQL